MVCLRLFQVIKQGLSASSLLDRGVQLMGENNRYFSDITISIFNFTIKNISTELKCLNLDISVYSATPMG